MSSRFPPPGESRYTPRDRDRSPSRFERRGSTSSGPIRNSDNSYRPGDSNSNSRDISGAPRGPSGRGGSYTPRGRTYGGRESRDGQFYRRDSDRDFSRRDTERRSPPSRNRSRTPPPTRDFRDARDNRDAQLRSLDMTRVTRESRDNGPSSATSAASDGGTSSTTYRGGFRSRGRGDWDRGSSRRNFDDRDSFRARSRSRDRWDRDRDRDRDRDYDRESRRDDDVRDRDNDRVRRDPPVRPDSRNSVSSQAASTNGGSNDRRDGPKASSYSNDTPRRSSFAQSTGRPELVRGGSTTQTPSSPVHYPQVPEFGAIKTSATPSSDPPRSAPTSTVKDELSPGVKSENADPTRIAPKGPKADLATQPPTAPKAFPRRPGYPEQSPSTRKFDDAPPVTSPTSTRTGPSGSPSLPSTTLNRPRTTTWTNLEVTNRPAAGFLAYHEDRNAAENNNPAKPADIKIPTGPKANRDPTMRTPLSARTNKPGAMIWVNPQLHQSQQSKPSIMQSMHHKKDEDFSSRPSATSPTTSMRPGSRSSAMGDFAGRKSSTDMTAARRLTLSPGAAPSAIQGLRGNDADDDDDEDAIDDEDEDEDSPEFNQQDFERLEAGFQKQIESLQNRLAPSPRLNPKILTALETIDIYASAIEDYKNGYVPPAKPVEKEGPRPASTLSPTLSTRPTTMPTPPAESTQIKTEDDKSDIKDTVMVDLPLEGLTYLVKNPPTPNSFDLSGSEADEEDLCIRIRQRLAFVEDEDEDLRQRYRELYLQWRREVDSYDEEAAQQEALISRAATPMSALGTETAGTPVPESGRRSTRNATEMDVERIMKESAQEHQAAEMAQVPVDMSVDPDMAREADIPDMLTEEDQGFFVFEDINNRIPNSADIMTPGAPEDNPVFKAYDYLPVEDDFDSDDQERFKDAYARFPKQWGFLAKNMNESAAQIEPGDEKLPLPKKRDYHQCILHYYMTKKQAKPAYKLLPNRKGKKRKAAGPSRRANQRSSMLGNGEDGAVRISDTGRPKRAAAPSFNDKEKREAEALAQKAAAKEKKATSLLTKPGADGSSGQEKTPARRSRKKEGDKSSKRSTKATALAASTSPSRNGDAAAVGVDVPMQDSYRSRVEDAQLLAGFHEYGASNQTPQKQPVYAGGVQNETWRVDPRVQASTQMSGDPVMPPQSIGMSVLDQRGALAQTGAFSARQGSPSLANLQGAAVTTSGSSRTQTGTSSYWSVQEQTRFVELVKLYGKDWPSISKHLPSKTETMIKNNFERGGKGNGQDHEAKARLEEFAAEAERRIAREGPPTPPDPLPQIAPPATNSSRRRAGPAASQRALAPNLDHIPEVPAPPQVNADARATIGVPIPQGSPQDHSHPRLAPARQTGIPVSQGQEILASGRTPQLSSRTQPGISQGQGQTSPYAHIDAERIRPGVHPHDPISSLQSSQSKRPRSISEQDRHLHEQPAKRQGMTYEEFNNAAAMQHEQQQRAMHRSDSQQSYDYRQPQMTQAGYPPSTRMVSNPEEVDRRTIRAASPGHYYKERDAYGAGPYSQQPPHPNSMASVMGGPRSILGSPGQRVHADLPRPNSVAAITNRPPPAPVPTSTPAPAQKRSNIMSLLNDDPPEEKRPIDTRPIVPARHDSPMANTPMYQTPSQQSYQRRDIIDPVRESHGQRSYAPPPPPPPPTYGSPATQTQSYNGPSAQTFAHQHQHQSQPRETYRYYNEQPRAHEPPRYQQPPHAASPPPGQQSSYHIPRATYDAPSHSHAGGSSSHSRATSYSVHPHSSTAGPGQALAPSPYAAIRPSNMTSSIGHHAPTPSPQHPIYHPGNQGHPTMSGTSRAATAFPGQLGQDQRRVEEHPGMRRYGTPSHTPPNNGGYGYPPPQ